MKVEITNKVNLLLNRGDYTKTELSEELGITRPTLNTRLSKHNWKKLEIEKVNKIWSS